MQETTIGVERCIQCGTMLGCIKYGLNDKYPLCSACATPINTPMHPYHPAYSWKNRGDVLADINEELRARIAALEAALRTVKACLRGSDALGIVTEVREDGSLGPSIEDVIERALRGEDNGG